MKCVELHVNRHLLWHKLYTQYSFEAKFMTALEAMYTDVRSSVKVNQLFTDWFDVTRGVKQGCLLSPTLFALYIMI